jgi:cytidylate kinase
MIIAIDGPAGSGKSTTARAVADRLGYLYLDTGAMYRAVGLAFARAGVAPSERTAPEVLAALDLDLRHGAGGQEVWLGGENVSEAIRTPEASRAASDVATLPAVREALVAQQRRLAAKYVAQGGGVVLDGRDIGTVVFPDADVKVFLVADLETRARRRAAEQEQRGLTADVAALVEEIRARDEQDASRAVGPLRKASDAAELDTSTLSIEEQVERVLALARERSHS